MLTISKKIITLFLSVSLLIFPLMGCQISDPAIAKALIKTQSATALRADFAMALSRDGIADMMITGGSKISKNEAGTAGQIYLFAEIAVTLDSMVIECFVDFDITDENNPYINAVIRVPEQARAEMHSAEYVVLDTDKLDSDYFEVLKSADLFGINNIITVITDNLIWKDVEINDEGYISQVGFSADLSELAGEIGATLEGAIGFSEYNQPFDFKMPAVRDDNSLDFAEWIDDSDVHVYLNGKKLIFPNDSTLFQASGYTMVPMRYLVEKMGGEIYYYQDDTNRDEVEVVTGKLNETDFALFIDSTTAYVKEQRVELTVPSVIVNKRTRVPIRFLTENFDKNISFYQKVKYGKEIMVINIED